MKILFHRTCNKNQIQCQKTEYLISLDGKQYHASLVTLVLLALLLLIMLSLHWFLSLYTDRCSHTSSNSFNTYTVKLIFLLTLFIRLIYANVLHWMVSLYYHGFLINLSWVSIGLQCNKIGLRLLGLSVTV